MWKKNDDKKQKPRKMSKILTQAVVSGDEWLETVQIIQALQPVTEVVRNQIEGFENILSEYSDKGGTIEKIVLEDDTYQIRFALRESTWVKVFDSAGTEIRDVKDDRSGSKDQDAMLEIARAIRAALEIPRREFVVQELGRLRSYLESDNALSGLEKMKKVFEQDPTILFEAASAVAPDSLETDVDMIDVIEARGKA